MSPATLAPDLPPRLEETPARFGGRPAVRAMFGFCLLVAALFFCRLVINGGLPSAFCASLAQGNIPVGRCILKQKVGVPCAFCGSTRAWAELSHGHVAEACRYNPVMTGLAMGGLFVCGVGMFKPRVYRAAACYSRRLLRRKSGLQALLLFALLNWIYLVLSLP